MNARVIMNTTLYFLLTTAVVYLLIVAIDYPLPNPAFILGGLIGTGGGVMTWFNDASPRQQRTPMPLGDRVQLGSLLAFLTVMVAAIGQFVIQWMPQPQTIIPFTASLNLLFPVLLGSLFWQAFAQKNKQKRK